MKPSAILLFKLIFVYIVVVSFAAIFSPWLILDKEITCDIVKKGLILGGGIGSMIGIWLIYRFNLHK